MNLQKCRRDIKGVGNLKGNFGHSTSLCGNDGDESYLKATKRSLGGKGGRRFQEIVSYFPMMMMNK